MKVKCPLCHVIIDNWKWDKELTCPKCGKMFPRDGNQVNEDKTPPQKEHKLSTWNLFCSVCNGVFFVFLILGINLGFRFWGNLILASMYSISSWKRGTRSDFDKIFCITNLVILTCLIIWSISL